MNKLKVQKEGREGIYLPKKHDLKDFILSKKLKKIHNFISNGSMFLGADHSIKSVLEDIDAAERLAVLTGRAAKQNMGHALAIIRNNRLEVYDIGEVTDADLEVAD